MHCLVLICFLVLVLICRANPCEVELSVPENNNNLVEGDLTTLTCETSSCDVKYVTLQKQVVEYEPAFKIVNKNEYEGYMLSNNITYDDPRIEGNVVRTNYYLMAFSRVILEDSGFWQCTVNDDEIHSNELELIVDSNEESLNIIVETPSFILLGSSFAYTCLCDRVSPMPTIIWTVNGENLTIGSNNTVGHGYWNVSSTYTNILMENVIQNVLCTLITSNWEKPKPADEVENFVPARIDDIRSNPQEPNPSSNLTITCVAIGTGTTITWMHNGTMIDDDNLYDESLTNVSGEYEFKEKQALQSTLVWKPPSTTTCESIHLHDGAYKCLAVAVKGEPVNTEEEQIFLQYGPILTDSSVDERFVKVNETTTMNCDVACARPDELQYEWTSENAREGLEQDKSIIYITVGKADFNDIFYCNVTNNIDNSVKIFRFREKDVDPPSTTEDPTTLTITTTDDGNVTIPKPPNTALIIANAVIWSLCGVVGIVLVCLAMYHYRQIQNGKQYQEDDSDEIVLTDDEEKPGTSHGFDSGEYSDISHSLVGKIPVGGAFSRVTTDGLYAEVQTSAQTQMPVAPKRASKVKTSQPEPSTPQAERTHATNAPKSPMNVQHQANSPSFAERQEPTADYSPASKRKDIPPSHSSESNHGMASKVLQQQKRHGSPNKQAAVKQSANGTKPSVPVKPDIQSFRSSRSSGINPDGAPYDNAEVNMYANCDQRPEPKNDDGTITYADLALQQKDSYEEGAPPVPKKNMTDQEPVQYASIKRSK